MTRTKLLAKIVGDGKPVVYVRWQNEPEQGIYETGSPVGGSWTLTVACERDAALETIRQAFADREIVLY